MGERFGIRCRAKQKTFAIGGSDEYVYSPIIRSQWGGYPNEVKPVIERAIQIADVLYNSPSTHHMLSDPGKMSVCILLAMIENHGYSVSLEMTEDCDIDDHGLYIVEPGFSDGKYLIWRVTGSNHNVNWKFGLRLRRESIFDRKFNGFGITGIFWEGFKGRYIDVWGKDMGKLLDELRDQLCIQKALELAE